jgi:hypothetical protein
LNSVIGPGAFICFSRAAYFWIRIILRMAPKKVVPLDTSKYFNAVVRVNHGEEKVNQ